MFWMEFIFYEDNSYVRDGILYIKPTLTADTYDEDFLYHEINPIQSARIRTFNSFNFINETVKIRAIMHRGDCIWLVGVLVTISKIRLNYIRLAYYQLKNDKRVNNCRNDGRVTNNDTWQSTVLIINLLGISTIAMNTKIKAKIR